MVVISQKGDFNNTKRYFERLKDVLRNINLDRYAEEGLLALEAGTPKDTGLTSKSWNYKILWLRDRVSINFYNSNKQNGVPIAIILQYGHRTKNGGWVEGRDYINPALKPIFDRLSEEVWKEVTRIE